MSTRAVAFVAAFAAFAPKMPEQCNKVLGKTPAPAGSASATVTAEPAASASTQPVTPPPTATITAPPIWTPPEATTAAGAASSSPPAAADPDTVAARAAHAKKDWKKVRALLLKKLKAGKANDEDVELLGDACQKLKDKLCTELVASRHDL